MQDRAVMLFIASLQQRISRLRSRNRPVSSSINAQELPSMLFHYICLPPRPSNKTNDFITVCGKSKPTVL